ncbi:hypothetical protein C483_06515 [Natrialba hulunbeirensis JCM 10989]|uniref:DUF1102 domain-containing protein n=1 Tax=Natrialba hulunbeirensis JCM 10989 TaxID=1227493 RepID=M0A6K0_9EURY|nr:hypothetical protein [Natrialba hulunbeirensis]ELY92963.1 hypothetical protein C483_06515 [Natrialba hulunbeirensis JCM 10989]
MNQSRTVHLTLLVAVLFVASAVGTGAVPLPTESVSDFGADSAHEQDAVIDDIILEPHDGPNGVYAVVENETFAIELTETGDRTGVPPDAVSDIQNVFTVTYTGTEQALVWLESDRPELEYHSAAGPIGSEDEGVVLKPNESVAVGVTLDATGYAAGDVLDGVVEVNAVGLDDADDSDGSATPTPAPPAGSTCQPASVAVDSPSLSERTVSVTDVQPCKPERIPLQSLPIGDETVLESMAIAFTDEAERGDEVSFEILTSDADTGDTDSPKSPLRSVGDLHEETGSAPIGSYTVSGLATEDVKPLGTVQTVAIDQTWLETTGLDTASLTAYQYDGTTWQERELEFADSAQTEGDHDEELVGVIRGEPVVTALGVDAPLLRVEPLTVEEPTASGDETTVVSTTIENEVDEEAAVALDLVVGGEHVTERTLTVDPNESTDVSFDLGSELDSSVTSSGGGDDESVSAEAVELSYAYTPSSSSFIVAEGTVQATGQSLSDAPRGPSADGEGDQSADRGAGASGSGGDDGTTGTIVTDSIPSVFGTGPGGIAATVAAIVLTIGVLRYRLT